MVAVAIPVQTTPPTAGQRPYQPFGAARDLFYAHDPEVLIEGPAGCVAGEVRLYDATTDTHIPIRQLVAEQRAPVVMTLAGPVQAEMPFRKGVADLYRLHLASGREVITTLDHRVRVGRGWTRVGDLHIGEMILVSAAYQPPSVLVRAPQGSVPGASRWNRIPLSSLAHYSPGYHHGDARLPWAADTDQAPPPLPADALAHSHADPRLGGHYTSPGYSRPDQLPARRAMLDYSAPSAQTADRGCCAAVGSQLRSRALCQSAVQFPKARHPRRPTDAPHQRVDDKHPSYPQAALARAAVADGAPALPSLPPAEPFVRYLASADTSPTLGPVALLSDAYSPSLVRPPKSYSNIQWDTVSSLIYERTDEYFDLHVPGVEHYLAEGIWHHNTGKSLAVLEKLNLCCSKYPGIRVLLARKTRESCTESVLVTFEDQVLPEGSPLKAGPDRAHRQRYTYPNGSTLVVGGLDKSSRIMSTQYDLIYVPEATEITQGDWEDLSTRNRNHHMPYQQMIADCNPGPPTHWLNQRALAGGMRRLLSRHQDNPLLWDRAAATWTPAGVAYLATLGRLSGARKVRLLAGLWAAAEGLVYEDWDPAAHIVEPFPIPAEWSRWRAVDFGYTNPFVCQWWTEDPDGRLYLYRELYVTGQLVEDLADEITTLSADESFAGGAICDWDAEDRATLERHGIPTIPAIKDVSPGIQAMQARLRGAGDGKPRLFVLRDALVRRDPRRADAKRPCGFVEEIEGYVWEPATDGKPNKEAPHKDDDHSMDTARYMVAARGLDSPGVFF